MDNKLLLDVQSAASALSISESTLRRLVIDKRINAVRIGSRLLFSKTELDKFVERLAAGDSSMEPKKRGRKRLAA